MKAGRREVELGWNKAALQTGQWRQEDTGALFLGCLAAFCSKLCWQHKPFPPKAPPFPNASDSQTKSDIYTVKS